MEFQKKEKSFPFSNKIMIKFNNAFDLIKLVSVINQKIKFNVKYLKIKKTHII